MLPLMKNSIMIIALGVVAVAALVTFSNSTAQDVPGDRTPKQQKVVVLNGADSYTMANETKVSLPGLLEDGWWVVSISQGGTSLGYALLEK